MGTRSETGWRVGFKGWVTLVKLVQEAAGHTTVLVGGFPAPVHASGQQMIELFLFGQRACLQATDGRWQLTVDGGISVESVEASSIDAPQYSRPAGRTAA